MKSSLSATLFSIICLALNVDAFEFAKNSQKDMIFSAPKFSVLSEKPVYVLYEPLSIRFIVENTNEEPIKTILGIISDPIESMGVINIDIKGPDKKAEIYKSASHFSESPIGILNPHEHLSRDYLLSCRISTSGEYALNSSYTWRDSGPRHKLSYKDRRANADEVSVHIIEPQSVDKQALDYVGDPMMLMAIQNIENLVWMEKLEDIKALRPAFLAKFPTSTYARNVLFAMAENQKRDGQFKASLENFEKYIQQYPDSWFVDDALYACVEYQIELKEYDEAKKGIEKLLGMQTDAKIQRMADRLKRGLEKGGKTLDQMQTSDH